MNNDITEYLALVGRRLKNARENINMPINEAAKKVNLEALYLEKIEKGEADLLITEYFDLRDLYGLPDKTFLDENEKTAHECGFNLDVTGDPETVEFQKAYQDYQKLTPENQKKIDILIKILNHGTDKEKEKLYSMFVQERMNYLSALVKKEEEAEE